MPGTRNYTAAVLTTSWFWRVLALPAGPLPPTSAALNCTVCDYDSVGFPVTLALPRAALAFWVIRALLPDGACLPMRLPVQLITVYGFWCLVMDSRCLPYAFALLDDLPANHADGLPFLLLWLRATRATFCPVLYTRFAFLPGHLYSGSVDSLDPALQRLACPVADRPPRRGVAAGLNAAPALPFTRTFTHAWFFYPVRIGFWTTPFPRGTTFF